MAEKTRKKPVIRTDAQLAGMGVKGQVYLVVRKAFALADKNGFSGTVRAGKKFPNGVLYSKGKDGGAYWKAAEDGAEFKDLKAAAKSAVSDLKQLKYTDKVKKVVDLFSEMGGGGRGGSKLNMSALDDLSF